MRAACSMVLAALLASAAPAAAQEPPAADETPACGPRITLTYEEAVPDFFTIKNLSPAGWVLEALTIDLTSSAGQAIFDTEAGGPGVNGAEQFNQYHRGPVRLTAVTPVADGDRALALAFEGFVAQERFVFFIDLDDTAPNSPLGQALLTFGEIAGSKVTARLRGPTGDATQIEAVFGDRGIADSGAGGCV